MSNMLYVWDNLEILREYVADESVDLARRRDARQGELPLPIVGGKPERGTVRHLNPNMISHQTNLSEAS
jgi:hypothetical protein